VTCLEKCVENLRAALCEQLQSESLIAQLNQLKLTDMPLLVRQWMWFCYSCNSLFCVFAL